MHNKRKIYFVSDVHLGAPALKNNRERELLFAQWLDQIQPDVEALYLLGDIFDFWFEYKKVVPRGFTRILGRIANLTDKGVPVYFFPGNHDLWASDYFTTELGVSVYHHYVVKTIKGKVFFLAHGDGLDADDKGYLRLKKIFTNKLAQWLFSRLHPNFAFSLAHRWSSSSRLSKSDIDDNFMVNKDGMYKFATGFPEKDRVDYFVMGHRHRMANVAIDDKARFILLGDWINSFSYGVFDGDTFELKKFKDTAAG